MLGADVVAADGADLVLGAGDVLRQRLELAVDSGRSWAETSPWIEPRMLDTIEPMALTNLPRIDLTSGLRTVTFPAWKHGIFRGLGRAAQEALRRRALFLIEHEGMTQAQAALAVGVQRQTVNIWRGRYRERGEDALLDGRRVSPRRGRGRLTGDEARQVRAGSPRGRPTGWGCRSRCGPRARSAS